MKYFKFLGYKISLLFLTLTVPLQFYPTFDYILIFSLKINILVKELVIFCHVLISTWLCLVLKN